MKNTWWYEGLSPGSWTITVTAPATTTPYASHAGAPNSSRPSPCHRTVGVSVRASSVRRKPSSDRVSRKSSISSGAPQTRSYQSATSATGSPSANIRRACAPSSGNTA